MHNWKEFNISAENISDDNNLFHCPKCQPSRKNKDNKTLLVYNNNLSWFCKHCGFSGDLNYGPKNIYGNSKNQTELNPIIQGYAVNYNLNNKLIEKFKTKGITEKTLQKYHISQSRAYYFDIETEHHSLVFPYYKNNAVVNLVYMAAGKRGSEKLGEQICYGYDEINLEHTIFVSDEIEKLTFFEAGFSNVISIFGGENYKQKQLKNNTNLNLDFLANVEDKIKDVKKFTLAMPHNDYGFFLLEELLRRLGKERCWTVKPMEAGSNWNNLFVNFGHEKFLEAFNLAKPFPVKGIFDIDDVEDGFDELYEIGLRKGFATGFASVDECYTVVPGQMSIVTGIPGHGKSNFLDALVVNLAMKHSWKFGIFSPENQPIQRHFANILEKYTDAPFNFGPTTRISMEQKESGKIWLKEHFSIILPDEDDSWSIDGILSLAKVLVYRRGIKGLIIDPWNELDHTRTNNQTETEYISSMLTKIRQFARNYDVHVWLVAHPAKLYKDKDGKYPVPTPYDIAGCHSSDTEVLTNRGFVIHKDITKDDDIVCFNMDNNNFEYHKPTKIWNYEYSGNMYLIEGEQYSCLVTPNHKMVYKNTLKDIVFNKEEIQFLITKSILIPYIETILDINSKDVSLSKHETYIIKPYTGIVHCLTVKTGAYVTRHNNKLMISGNSAHFRNKADNAITVWRNVGGKDQDIADIHVQKIRFKEVGKVGMVSLRYNPISGRFLDDIDQSKRRHALENGEEVDTYNLMKRK